jgi:hypothetical protein
MLRHEGLLAALRVYGSTATGMLDAAAPAQIWHSRRHLSAMLWEWPTVAVE